MPGGRELGMASIFRRLEAGRYGWRLIDLPISYSERTSVKFPKAAATARA